MQSQLTKTINVTVYKIILTHVYRHLFARTFALFYTNLILI